MSTLKTTNIAHPSSASNNIVLDASGNVVLQAGSASTPALQPSGDTNTGIFFPAADTIAFAKGGVEAARIDSSGRLLVGTYTVPTFRIGGEDRTDSTHITTKSGIALGASFAVVQWAGNTTSTWGNDVVLAKSFNGTVGTHAIGSSGNLVSRLFFSASDGTRFVPAASIETYIDGTPGNLDMPGRLVFSTTADGASSPTERMRLHSTGRLQVQGSDGQMFALGSTLAAGTTNYLFVCGHSATSFGSYTSSFVVYTNGNVQNTNGSYTTISDVKLKENIVDAGSQWDDFKAIQIRNWNFKAETGHETHRQIGPIAQELEQVCPGLVFETPDRDADGNDLGTVTKGVNQSVLYMKAVKALQEAMERIEQLEAKVAALESA